MRRMLVICALIAPTLCAAQESIGVGSKRFTESYILGEIAAQTVRSARETNVVHHRGLGNTAILFAALKSGAIDVYPEYTGTIAIELLREPGGASLTEINSKLASHGLAAAIRLG
ncbi:MAG TPA: glycine betaine ABC transporter substrate-binding protein, partial [Burkholderiales bacterium]|nr:glycine betaine ABC transporter substrate-binding protein [Burkholderiales bacterium]